ncbi:MAG TPA: cobalt ECF transporter T component CbiQ [Methanoregulaceae archaeon]|nr:cobalt ECF transporter T component CbiQ [Methanoregulaceae archaeon]
MIEDLFFLEKQTYKKSFIHNLDARVKIIVAFAAIIAVVSVPYTTMIYPVGCIFALLIAILWALSRLSPVFYFKRLIIILPFGLFLIFFQIFFKNRYYTTFTPIMEILPGIVIYAESIEFATILMIKFLVCISFVILLSSTTRVQDLLEGAGRLGLPAEFTLTLGMMIRYLFVFGYMYRKISQSLETRCFNPFDNSLPYRYRIRKLAYTIGTLFIRSYEQGERTYMAMLCRGYGRESHLYIKKKPLKAVDWSFLFCGMAIVVLTPLLVWFGVFQIL